MIDSKYSRNNYKTLKKILKKILKNKHWYNNKKL